VFLAVLIGAPRPPHNVSAPDLVMQRMEPTSRIGLGRPVQRMLQGTNRVTDGPHRGGTSRNGTHRIPLLHRPARERSSGPSLTGGCVVRTARPVLRPPPTPSRPQPTSRLLTGYRTRLSTPTAGRFGRGGSPQFPPSLFIRSAPFTPRSPSRLRLQALHRFHGLHRESPGSALPQCLTTRQASLPLRTA
jgi:hypothetical protein